MSVPADRMAVRQVGDPDKIMGVKKPIFYVIVAIGVVLAIWIYLRSRNSGGSASVGTSPDGGLTAADIGGTPADNSFATQTDQTALEEQIQQLQDAMNALQDSNGGNGAGLPGGSPGDGTSTGTPISSPNPPARHPIDYIPPSGAGTLQPLSSSSTETFGSTTTQPTDLGLISAGITPSYRGGTAIPN